ncbi:DegT/DnrJ/EryC1/StrS family aminotransferase [Streptomyces sp. JJ38]|uniref:DegT/DnrJ/EryC1/StrS family aminotransferase n=1 Tax=Streptomyces sp. JJ38 TaxID=2738128 RepID=UPI001C57F594|nr:DegT/DnrJ/EryC1/StrS family aminotransferase [Streptomyces sp. JJ38]MBW1595447.1 DegT/DnrJ/EryC1/StrS aminotransferase [Streptomyces sp. JJ38]
MGTSVVAAAGVRAGDEVVLPSYGGEWAAALVRSQGAVPVFADIDAASFCLDPAAVADVLSERTKAILPVALFGQTPDLEGLEELARRHDIVVIDPRELRDEAGAAAGASRRRQLAEYLNARLTGVVTPAVSPGREHLFTRYVVRVQGNGRPDRDAFRLALRSRGILGEVPILTPAHRIAGFRSEARLPETDRAAAESLALPVHEGLTRRQLHKLVSACNALGGLLPEPVC